MFAAVDYRFLKPQWQRLATAVLVGSVAFTDLSTPYSEIDPPGTQKTSSIFEWSVPSSAVE